LASAGLYEWISSLLSNRTDLQPEALARTADFGTPSAISILHPDDFCTSLYAKDPAISLTAIRALRERLRHPAKTALKLIETYERQGLPKMSLILRSEIELL
jgi:hypothetical protein